MLQRPCLSRPTSAAKQASESKRGAQNQSIDPPVDTRAVVSVLPMSPYSSMREAIAALLQHET
jgi:hypothetical protein